MEDLENDDSRQADEERKVLISLATSPDHEVAVIPLVIEKVVLPRLTGESSCLVSHREKVAALNDCCVVSSELHLSKTKKQL